jgi:hypothetical protein
VRAQQTHQHAQGVNRQPVAQLGLDVVLQTTRTHARARARPTTASGGGDASTCCARLVRRMLRQLVEDGLAAYTAPHQLRAWQRASGIGSSAAVSSRMFGLCGRFVHA